GGEGPDRGGLGRPDGLGSRGGRVAAAGGRRPGPERYGQPAAAAQEAARLACERSCKTSHATSARHGACSAKQEAFRSTPLALSRWLTGSSACRPVFCRREVGQSVPAGGSKRPCVPQWPDGTDLGYSRFMALIRHRVQREVVAVARHGLLG